MNIPKLPITFLISLLITSSINIACSNTIVQSKNNLQSIPALTNNLTVNGVRAKLWGNELLKVGEKIKNTDLVLPTDTFDTMKSVNLKQYKGLKLIMSVPSLDTPVCSAQTVILEQLAKQYPNVKFIDISADLPFALNKFCGNNKISNLIILSDFKDNNFAKSNKLFLEDYHLSTRAIFVVDNNDQILYVRYANEVTKELPLNEAIDFIKTYLSKHK